MKRTFYVLVIALVVSGSSMAVVGGPEAPEDGAAITSGSSATTSVTEDGVEWRSSIDNFDAYCRPDNMSTGAKFGEVEQNGSSHTVTFSGNIATNTPCVQIETDIEKIGEDKYEIKLVDGKDNQGEGKSFCANCLGVREIEGEFTREGVYSAELVRGNRTLDSIQIQRESKGLLSRILSFLGL